MRGLSQRESECLFFIVSGKTASHTADKLFLSVRTVEKHIENIKIKFSCHTKSELILCAIHDGFTESQ